MNNRISSLALLVGTFAFGGISAPVLAQTAEIPFTAQVAGSCSVSGIQPGTLVANDALTELNTDANGSFEITSGCTTLNLNVNAVGANADALNNVSATVTLPGGTTVSSDDGLQNITQSGGTATVEVTANSAAAVLPEGEYAINVTAVMTAN